MKTSPIYRTLALTATFCNLALYSIAGTVNIDDKGNVLTEGKQQIESAAAAAPFNVHVLTRNNMLSKSGLDNAVNDAAKFGGKNTVAIGVDTELRHLHIGAQDAGVTKQQVDDAQRTAGSKFKQGDWAGGVAAAITDLARAAGSSTAGAAAAGAVAGRTQSPTAGQSSPAPAPKSGGFPWGLLILAAIAFFAFRWFMNRRRAQGNAYGQQGVPPGPGGYPPGQYPPGGYPQQQQGGGMGGMGGGLLGGLGGGLLGYHLGRNSGQQDPGGGLGGGGQNSGDPGGGFISGDSGAGDFGDSGGGDFGGGDSGDF